jgi:hypothetical protein
VTQRSADDVAYWLEVAEGRAYADLYRAIASNGDPLGASWTVDGDLTTFLLHAVDDGFFNRSIGLGIGDAATEDAVDRVIGRFVSAGRTAWVAQVSPLARPTAVEHWLEARGLGRGRRWAKLWRDTDDPPPERTDLRIEPIGPEHAADWASVVLAAFELPEALGPYATATLGRPDWYHYVAYDGDLAVGAGATYVRDGVAWLGFGSTLQSHRGRGSQSSIFARRVRDARGLGARLCITETGEETPDDPNPSYRNMLRAGFRLAYQRQNWLAPKAATTGD